MTDENGYVNFDIRIPTVLPTETWSSIELIPEGPLTGAFCRIWPWTESSLATYTAWQATAFAPTQTPPPEQAAVTATQQALHNNLDEYCIYQNQAEGFRFSPNNQWVEVFCSSDTIEIVRMDETQKWELSSDSLIGPYTEHFIGVDHWSKDGAYAYVSLNPHTDGYWEPFHKGIVLYRLNLETGQVSEVLPLGKSDTLYYSFAFSPNDRRLAYIVTDQSPVILNIRDMPTGEEQSFEFDPKYNTGGGFVWSPDSQKLVFSVTQFDTNTYEYIATSIILWDKDTSELTELVKDHPSEMRVIEWADKAKIILKAVILESGEIKTQNYELDLTTNSLTEINP